MYKSIKGGTTIGLTEFLTYIKQHDNGCFVLCPEPEALGIAFDGKVYHLLGREALEGVSTIMLEEVDAGSEITKAKETNGIVFVTLAEAGSIDDATAAEHADLFAEWAYPVAYKVGQIRRYNGCLLYTSYTAYDSACGSEIHTLIGSAIHSEIVTSELKRFIIEALMVNPYISELSNFQFTRTESGVQVEFDCTTIYGAMTVEWDAKEVRAA